MIRHIATIPSAVPSRVPGQVPSIVPGSASASASAWTPLALFTGGEAGAWYDPSDLSTVWQDAAGTTAAGVDDPVGRIDDKSGNGNNATQSTAAKRPILRQSGSLYYLEFDGVDDCLTISSITLGVPVTLSAALELASGPFIFEHSASASANQGFLFYGSNSEAWRINRSSVMTGAGASNWAGTDPTVVTLRTSTTQSECAYYKDGVDQSTTRGGASSLSDSDITDAFNIFSRNGSSLFTNGNLFHFLLIDRRLTDAEMDRLWTEQANKSGVSL